MRATLIPLPFFLDAAIRAGGLRHRIDVRSSLVPRYVGIVVVLDRKAERHSHLLDDLVREGSSINDVTRHDLLVAVPGQVEEQRPGVNAWVKDPRKEWDGIGAPGLLLAGADDSAWATRLWELVSDRVEQCQSHEDQQRIARAVDQSASSVCDYLGLSEADVPSLVFFSLVDRRVFVFRYGGDADDPPYQLFKDIAARRPQDDQPGWLAEAVEGVARDRGLAEGSVPVLSPPALADWQATCYLPQPADARPLRPMLSVRKRDLVVAGRAIGGVGLTGAVLYLVATVPTHVHVYWPYWIFLVGVLGGVALYLAGQERAPAEPKQPGEVD
jgi:hypothetical protein